MNLNVCGYSDFGTLEITDGNPNDEEKVTWDSDYDSDEAMFNPLRRHYGIKIYKRSAVVGGDIVKKRADMYVYCIKKEYMPEDRSERRAFCMKILERAVDRFAAEAFCSLFGQNAFRARVTQDEHQKLCGMDEVESSCKGLIAQLD